MMLRLPSHSLSVAALAGGLRERPVPESPAGTDEELAGTDEEVAGKDDDAAWKDDEAEGKRRM